MITSIAWRNVWRSRGRSLVVIAAVALGIWAVVFAMGMTYGMVNSFVKNAVESQYSHLQIHHPEFKTNQESKFTIPNSQDQLNKVKAMEGVESATQRYLVTGMLNTAKGNQGVQIVGINPDEEATITKLDTHILEGDYLPKDKRKPILISKGNADKLKLGVRKKVVLTFQDQTGEIVSDAFRVAGIFSTGNSSVDDMRVYIKGEDLNKLTLNNGDAHQIAVYLKNPDDLDKMEASLKGTFDGQLVETWREVAPEMAVMESSVLINQVVVLSIILLALIFGIINTMLMAVLERTKELGMLMAVGMNKKKVYAMIMQETVMLSLVGVPIGLLIGWGTISYYNKNGMDFSSYSEGLQGMGVSEFVYPYLEPNMYFIIAALVGVTAVVAALYPAYKAISLKPVEAIRTI